MSLTSKLQNWTAQNFLTKQQANLIQTYEQSRPTNLCFILLRICAGLFMALGFGAIFVSPHMSNAIRIAAVSSLLLLTSAGLFWSIQNKRPIWREVCIALAIALEAFLLVLIVVLYHPTIEIQTLNMIFALISIHNLENTKERVSILFIHVLFAVFFPHS